MLLLLHNNNRTTTTNKTRWLTMVAMAPLERNGSSRLPRPVADAYVSRLDQFTSLERRHGNFRRQIRVRSLILGFSRSLFFCSAYSPSRAARAPFKHVVFKYCQKFVTFRAHNRSAVGAYSEKHLWSQVDWWRKVHGWRWRW